MTVEERLDSANVEEGHVDLHIDVGNLLQAQAGTSQELEECEPILKLLASLASPPCNIANTTNQY